MVQTCRRRRAAVRACRRNRRRRRSSSSLAFFADLERELEKVEFFRPPEKRGTMSINLRNIFTRMQPTQQDIQTLHGVIMAIARGPQRSGARRRARRRAGAKCCATLLAEHGQAHAPSERGPVRGLARLLRRNPTEAERALWKALANDRRFAGRGFKRQTPIGPHIGDFVSFPLRMRDRSGAGGRRARPRRRRAPEARLAGRARLSGGRCEAADVETMWQGLDDSTSLDVAPDKLDRRRSDRRVSPCSAFSCAAAPARSDGKIAADREEFEAALGHAPTARSASRQ